MDIAWTVSQLCEEFHCTPTEALREMEDCPAPLLATILEFRAYARAKQALEQAKSAADVPRTPAVELVFEIEATLWKRRQAAHANRGT